MGLKIHKYGGSVLQCPEDLQAVADHIAHAVQQGGQLVVVVSALAGETDALEQMASNVVGPFAQQSAADREYSALLAIGEQKTAALLSMLLNSQGIKAQSCNAYQTGLAVKEPSRQASISAVDPTPLQALLARGVLPIVCGFQGLFQGADMATLGRGGSDLTAVALAAALGAEVCRMYQDVDGVYTADPHLEPDAKKTPELSIRGLKALCQTENPVIQLKALEYAEAHGVVLNIRSLQGQGTHVSQKKFLFHLPKPLPLGE